MKNKVTLKHLYRGSSLWVICCTLMGIMFYFDWMPCEFESFIKTFTPTNVLFMLVFTVVSFMIIVYGTLKVLVYKLKGKKR